MRLEQSSSGTWRVVSEDAYEEGAQVFNSYGEQGLANFQLLLHRGFAIRDGDSADVLGFDDDDLLAAGESVSRRDEQRIKAGVKAARPAWATTSDGLLLRLIALLSFWTVSAID